MELYQLHFFFFSRNQIPVSLVIFTTFFFFSSFIDFCSYFLMPFLLLALGLLGSSFFSFLWWELRLLIENFPFFYSKNFPFSTAVIASHICCYVTFPFSFSLMYGFISFEIIKLLDHLLWWDSPFLFSSATLHLLAWAPQLPGVFQQRRGVSGQGQGRTTFSWLLILSRIFTHSPLPMLLCSRGVVDGTPVQSSGGMILPRLSFNDRLSLGYARLIFTFAFGGDPKMPCCHVVPLIPRSLTLLFAPLRVLLWLSLVLFLGIIVVLWKGKPRKKESVPSCMNKKLKSLHKAFINTSFSCPVLRSVCKKVIWTVLLS